MQVLFDDGVLVRNGEMKLPVTDTAQDTPYRAGDSGLAHRPLAAREKDCCRHSP